MNKCHNEICEVIHFLFLFLIKRELVLFIIMKSIHITNAVQLGFETLTFDVKTSNLFKQTIQYASFLFFVVQHVH